MFNLLLHSPDWQQFGNVYVRGYAFSPNDQLLRGEALAAYVDVPGEHEWASRLKSLNGIYAVIRNAPDFAAAAIDISRIFPLFFRHDADAITITDDPYALVRHGDKLSSLGVKQYLASGNTFDGYTLVDSIRQLRPAEYLTSDGSHAPTFSLCVPLADVHTPSPDSFSACLDHVFSRLISSLDGRQVVLPLSGGYDSRLIACMLHKHGYKNVVCFTAGRPDNVEVQVSPQVAKTLGFKFYNIDTTVPELVELISSSNPDFVRYSRHLGSLTNFQWLFEYAAVIRLRQLDAIAPDAVFVPGHTADVAAGSSITRAVLHADASIGYMVSALLHDNFEYGGDKSLRPFVADCLKRSFSQGVAPWSLFQNFITRDVNVPNINNSARVYEFFVHEVRLPFYDAEFLSFFAHVPLDDLLLCRFYSDYVNNHVFKPLGVFFPRQSCSLLHYKVAKIRKHLKPFIPSWLLNRRQPIPDHVGEFSLAANLRKEMGSPLGSKTCRSSNALLRDWYLQTVRNLLNS